MCIYAYEDGFDPIAKTNFLILEVCKPHTSNYWNQINDRQAIERNNVLEQTRTIPPSFPSNYFKNAV